MNVSFNLLCYLVAFLKPELLAELDANWNQLAPYILDFNYTVPQSQHAEVAEKAKQYYLQGAKSFAENRSHDLIQVIFFFNFIFSK